MGYFGWPWGYWGWRYLPQYGYGYGYPYPYVYPPPLAPEQEVAILEFYKQRLERQREYLNREIERIEARIKELKDLMKEKRRESAPTIEQNQKSSTVNPLSSKHTENAD